MCHSGGSPCHSSCGLLACDQIKRKASQSGQAHSATLRARVPVAECCLYNYVYTQLLLLLLVHIHGYLATSILTLTSPTTPLSVGPASFYVVWQATVPCISRRLRPAACYMVSVSSSRSKARTHLGSTPVDGSYSDRGRGGINTVGLNRCHRTSCCPSYVPQNAECHDGDSAFTTRGSNRSTSGHAHEGSGSAV